LAAMTGTGFVRMRISKVVGLRDGDHIAEFVVLDEPGGDRHLLIQIGQAEAIALAANLDEMEWGRPMTCQFMARLVRSLGGRIRVVRLDRPGRRGLCRHRGGGRAAGRGTGGCPVQ
jgi:bifunctional DNase/RNase